MAEQQEETVTLDDIDEIEKHLRKIQSISVNGYKPLIEEIELKRQKKITTLGYHLQLEIEEELTYIREILGKFTQAQMIPCHRNDMDKAAHIREMKDNIKVVDCTG
jgi:hypothetical protein